MVPWLIPIIQKVSADKQAEETRARAAQEQLHAMRARLAGQLGAPGYQAQGARDRYQTDRAVDQQTEASNAAILGSFMDNYWKGAPGVAGGNAGQPYDPYSMDSVEPDTSGDAEEIARSRNALRAFGSR